MAKKYLNQHLETGKLTNHGTACLLTTLQFPELTGLKPVSAVEAKAQAITVAGQASSFTMLSDHLEEDTGPAPGSGSSRGPDIAGAVCSAARTNES
jgi:hypothetical protein